MPSPSPHPSVQTSDVLSAIEDVFPTLDASVQKSLLAGLRNPGKLEDDFLENLRSLVDASPVLTIFTSSMKANAKGSASIMMGPLLFWALTKPWSRDVPLDGMSSYLSRWVRQMGGSRYSTTPPIASFVLSTMTPMLDTHLEMSSAKKRKLLTSVYKDVREMSGLDMLIRDTHRHQGGVHHFFETLMVQMGVLAERCCGQEILNDRLVSDVWACDAAKLSSPDPSSSFLLHVLTSPLSDTYKRNVCVQLESNTWVKEEIAPHICALLPQNEHVRLQQLPWTWNTTSTPTPASQTTARLANAKLNQQLAKMYCPRLYPLFELMVSNEHWGDKETIFAHARLLSKPASKAYELPTNLELSL